MSEEKTLEIIQKVKEYVLSKIEYREEDKEDILQDIACYTIEALNRDTIDKSDKYVYLMKIKISVLRKINNARKNNPEIIKYFTDNDIYTNILISKEKECMINSILFLIDQKSLNYNILHLRRFRLYYNGFSMTQIATIEKGSSQYMSQCVYKTLRDIRKRIKNERYYDFDILNYV